MRFVAEVDATRISDPIVLGEATGVPGDYMIVPKDGGFVRFMRAAEFEGMFEPAPNGNGHTVRRGPKPRAPKSAEAEDGLGRKGGKQALILQVMKMAAAPLKELVPLMQAAGWKECTEARLSAHLCNLKRAGCVKRNGRVWQHA